MNIKDLFSNSKKPEEQKYVKIFRRGAATALDLWIVLFLRALTMQLLGKLWLEQKIITFQRELVDTFGTESVKNTPEHLNFVIHSEAFLCSIIFLAIVVLVGAFYHSYLNSSAWQATVGKRLMKIIIVTEDESRISFLRSASHYFLSIFPFIFITYLVSYKIRHSITFFEVLTTSKINIFLGIIFIIWLQIHFFTKKKTTAYDMICGTILINGRTKKKFPWSKI